MDIFLMSEFEIARVYGTSLSSTGTVYYIKQCIAQIPFLVCVVWNLWTL